MSKRKAGTKEWASSNVNIMTGCEHGCRYCYARAMALRFGRIKSPEEWTRPELRKHEIYRKRRRMLGTVMFPSAHDITARYLSECVAVLASLLRAGNTVLIVSKPHIECIKEICSRFADQRDMRPRHLSAQITFRFTITGVDQRVVSYWEPGAPSWAERLACLSHAYTHGFQTSVSCEPMLDRHNLLSLLHTVEPFVTDTIWLGTMRRIRQRVLPGTSEEAIREIEQGQTPERLQALYNSLQGHYKLRWKDSIQQALGLKGPQG